MCGRYVLKRKDLELLLKQFGIRSLEEFHDRFNVAPTLNVPAIRPMRDGGREAVALKWGLVPGWAKDPKSGAQLANARAEGIEGKPAFRHAFRHKRCVVPASGFYEWQTIGRIKQPWYFTLREDEPFVFAGLWESWRSPDGVGLETFSLITTAANDVVGRIHDRMPVILPREHAEVWLDPAINAPEKLTPLLQPFPAERMVSLAVNPRVNSAMNEGPELLEPAPSLPSAPPAANGRDDSQLSLGI